LTILFIFCLQVRAMVKTTRENGCGDSKKGIAAFLLPRINRSLQLAVKDSMACQAGEKPVCDRRRK